MWHTSLFTAQWCKFHYRDATIISASCTQKPCESHTLTHMFSLTWKPFGPCNCLWLDVRRDGTLVWSHRRVCVCVCVVGGGRSLDTPIYFHIPKTWTLDWLEILNCPSRWVVCMCVCVCSCREVVWFWFLSTDYLALTPNRQCMDGCRVLNLCICIKYDSYGRCVG